MEFWDCGNIDSPSEIYNNTNCDTLVIAGDFGYVFNKKGGVNQRFVGVMKKLKHIYEHIVYVSGNHEFYNDKFTIDEIDFKLKNICDDLKIHYLQKDTWKHPATGVLFIGCTLWSDVFYEDVSLLNDYHKVFANDMYHWKSLHKDHQSWLQETIEMHKDVPIFVITHHLPSFLCIDEKLIENQVILVMHHIVIIFLNLQ